MSIEKVYLVRGKMFENKEEAMKYVELINKEDELVHKTLIEINEIKNKKHIELKLRYNELHLEINICRCIFGQNWSDECLIHFCTCDIFNEAIRKEYSKYICNRHTNTEFRNKGCSYCNYTDCSKNNC